MKVGARQDEEEQARRSRRHVRTSHSLQVHARTACCHFPGVIICRRSVPVIGQASVQRAATSAPSCGTSWPRRCHQVLREHSCAGRRLAARSGHLATNLPARTTGSLHGTDSDIDVLRAARHTYKKPFHAAVTSKIACTHSWRRVRVLHRPASAPLPPHGTQPTRSTGTQPRRRRQRLLVCAKHRTRRRNGWQKST